LLKRNPLDYQAYIETFRESLIDANPHQIEAITFALEKLENGGCILADEVGLGKTIEAGLIMAQYRAGRRFNILILVPTSLAGQWNNELRKRFRIPSKILTSKDKKGVEKNRWHELFKEDGVYIMGREFASRLEKERALSRKQWDLIIVDEAHEVFANIYRRYKTTDGEYNHESKNCKIAANLFRLLKRTPALLLTATPLQNNILEIWGLSSYILPETNKNYLGRYNHFRELFIKNGEVPEEKIPELKERLGNFLVRNLRFNAQAFMKYKFTQRHCETVNFHMDKQEKSLYDEISGYLDRDDIYAYSFGLIDLADERTMGLRNLLKLNYRRVLGSSFPALKKSLAGIVERLEKMIAGETLNIQNAAVSDDAENDEEDCLLYGVEQEAPEQDYIKQPRLTERDIANIESEILEVKGFIGRAEQIRETGKDRVLVKWLKEIFSQPERFYQKVVIFTTYVATQRHLKGILEENGFSDEIILFSGGIRRTAEEKEMVNRAVAVWEEEVGAAIPLNEKPAGNILERTALVYYFKNRKKIFISTETGAKGLNMQFCNALVNYDLPWNPQRIEQRIGRCHRYGQEKDVWVINCINADNETEKRIYDILLNKFDLFKSVIGAGDDILGTMSKAIQFEKRINDMMNRFKTKEERLIWLKRFEEEIDEETRTLMDTKLKHTRQLLDELDPNVTMRLKNIESKLPESFSRYDKDMLELLKNYSLLKALPFEIEKKDEEQILFRFGDKKYYIGKRDEENIRLFRHISLKHLLVQDIIAETRRDEKTLETGVYLEYSRCSKPGKALEPYVNRKGRWDFYNVCYSGIEEEEHLFDLLSVDDNGGFKLLNDEEITALKRLDITPAPGLSAAVGESDGKIILNKRIKKELLPIQNMQQPRLDRKLHNLEVELRDMEEFLYNKEAGIKTRMQAVDQKITGTYDRETGRKLIKEKENCQKELKSVRKELLNFQDHFQEMFDKEQIKLMGKRFIEAKPRRVFTLHFHIR
jgi:ERCC4-related helicase